MAAKSKAKRPAAKSATTRKAPAKKATARKAPARKAPAKKAPARKAPTRAAKKAPAKRQKPAITTALRKSDTIELISGETGVGKEDVRKVLEAREDIIERCLKPRGVGVYQDGRLLKFERYRRKATRKRIGRNLQTGEEIVIPARRERNAVKVKKLSRLRGLF